ncbi:hypothetical protein DM785_02615 [Deinococcus actinosclerus]|nr:hypothetical protein DM785_02615 [Deinococcus actinosclerus]
MNQLPDLLLGGIAVTVLASDDMPGSEYRFDEQRHPTLIVGTGSQEVQARAIFTFLHEHTAIRAQSQYAAHVLFGILKDNPQLLSFLHASQPPEYVDLEHLNLN